MEELRTIERRLMSCMGCRSGRSDHEVDDDWVPVTQALAWRVHAQRHHRGPVVVEKYVNRGWVVVDTLHGTAADPAVPVAARAAPSITGTARLPMRTEAVRAAAGRSGAVRADTTRPESGSPPPLPPERLDRPA